MNFIGKLSSLSRLQVRVMSVVMMVVVSYIDDVTGAAFSFTLFYMVPIVFASWFDGLRFAVILSVASACWIFHLEIPGLPFAVVFWNTSSSLFLLIGVAWILNAIHEGHRIRIQHEVDRYVRIVETVIEGLIALDASGNVKYANSRIGNLLGYPVSEMIGMCYTEFIREEHSRMLIEQRRKRGDGQDVGPEEVQFVKKDGTTVWTLANSNTSRTVHPEDYSLVLLVTDISERKRAEDELKRQYRQISAVHDLSSALVRSVHLETRLEDALKTVLDMTGFDAGAILLLDEKRNELTMKYHTGFRGNTVENIQQWPVGIGITGQVCRSGIPQFVDDAAKSDLIDPRIRELEGIRGFASVPLVSKDTVLGVVDILRRTPFVFSVEEQSLLRVFGSQIGVALDNAKLYDAARASEQHIRNLSIDLVRIQEEERKRFARELHDGLAQLLMTLRVNAELALKDLDATDVKMEKRLRELVALVGEAESEAKQISYDLRPAILDDFGLKAAIEVLAKQFMRRTGIEVDLHLPESDVRFESVLETTAYRIVQELLTNVAKHSQASLVTIQMLFRGNLLALTVADNGKGFHPGGTIPFADGLVHSGLRNMRERAESMRGMFRVESAPGRGAEFAIEIPCSLAALEMKHEGEHKE
jgi:PAS domain S-box-containing protein